MAHQELPLVYMARHGETAWSLSGQHTGLTDLPLTAVGESNAGKLRDALKPVTFTGVFSSPLRRAWRTCELAGFRSRAEMVHDLVECLVRAGEDPHDGGRQIMRPDAAHRVA